MTGSFDVAVLGAGSTGAATAYFAAKRGLSVCVLERHALDHAGARWVNDVPAWMFEAADLPTPDDAMVVRPTGDAATRAHAMILFAGWAGPSLPVRELRWYGIDMRALGSSLLENARRAGAVVRERVEVHGVTDGVVHTSDGDVRARTVVDASGLTGLNLLEMERAAREDLCAAAQEVRAVRDADRARAFFESRGAGLGDTLAFTGVHGGFSVMNARWFGDRVGLLAGTIPALGHPSGTALLHAFASEHDWIGEKLYGGSRAIPLSVPLSPFARGRVAHVGDAARQVFAAHGSGTGSGLVAARMLVDTLAAGREPSAYVTHWMRTYGALHCTFDLFRRFSQTLSAEDIALMIERGLLDDSSARAGIEQRWPDLGFRSSVRTLRAAARAPSVTARLARYLALAPVAAGLCRAFPDDPRAHDAAFKRVRQVFSSLPR